MPIRPNKATIIKKEKLSMFLNELNKNKVTKEYWDECAASKNAFSSSDIENMKKLCNGEQNER